MNSKNKKKKNTSKAKGNQYERIIAKKISKWLTGSEDELVCWRAVHSGSIGTIKKKKGQSGNNVEGDFQCLDSKYENFFNKFFIDSKSLGKVHLCLINPSNKKSNQLLQEWKKVCTDAQQSLKIPLMLVKATNDRKLMEFVFMPIDFSYLFENINYYETMHYVFMNHKIENEAYEDIVMISQDDFFSTNYTLFL